MLRESSDWVRLGQGRSGDLHPGAFGDLFVPGRVDRSGRQLGVFFEKAFHTRRSEQDQDAGWPVFEVLEAVNGPTRNKHERAWLRLEPPVVGGESEAAIEQIPRLSVGAGRGYVSWQRCAEIQTAASPLGF